MFGLDQLMEIYKKAEVGAHAFLAIPKGSSFWTLKKGLLTMTLSTRHVDEAKYAPVGSPYHAGATEQSKGCANPLALARLVQYRHMADVLGTLLAMKDYGSPEYRSLEVDLKRVLGKLAEEPDAHDGRTLHSIVPASADRAPAAERFVQAVDARVLEGRLAKLAAFARTRCFTRADKELLEDILNH